MSKKPGSCLQPDPTIYFEWLITHRVLIVSYVVSACFYYNKFAATNKGLLRCLAWLKQNNFFMYWFYYNLIVLIKQFKTPYNNLDKALLFSRKQVFCLKIWKIWPAPTTLQFYIFCWNFVRVSLLPMSTKACVGFFLFCLDLELLIKV